MMLFDLAAIPGLAMREALISAAEEQALIGQIGTVELSPFRFQGFTGKRLTRSFGWEYDFENGQFSRTEPVPAWAEPLRVRAAELAGLPAADLVQMLLIRYDPGSGIGWHRDRPVFDRVVGVSLGAPTMLAFRRRTATGFRRHKVALAPRSAYCLSGEARSDWEHGIASHDALRYSITFRSLRH